MRLRRPVASDMTFEERVQRAREEHEEEQRQRRRAERRRQREADAQRRADFLAAQPRRPLRLDELDPDVERWPSLRDAIRTIEEHGRIELTAAGDVIIIVPDRWPDGTFRDYVLPAARVVQAASPVVARALAAQAKTKPLKPLAELVPDGPLGACGGIVAA